MEGIVKQLIEIYKDEPWHKVRMIDDESFIYHKNRLKNGDIVVYVERGKVLGYFEAYYLGETCFLNNIYIKKEYRNGKVILKLRKIFFSNLPKGIKNIIGELQSENGRLKEVILRR